MAADDPSLGRPHFSTRSSSNGTEIVAQLMFGSKSFLSSASHPSKAMAVEDAAQVAYEEIRRMRAIKERAQEFERETEQPFEILDQDSSYHRSDVRRERRRVMKHEEPAVPPREERGYACEDHERLSASSSSRARVSLKRRNDHERHSQALRQREERRVRVPPLVGEKRKPMPLDYDRLDSRRESNENAW